MEHEALERAGHVRERQSALLRGDDFRIVAAAHVANHYQIRRWVEMLDREPSEASDAPRSERGPHRWIEANVAAGYSVPELYQ